MGLPSFVPIILAAVMAMAGGGPNDLLGYLSTDAYWKAKGVHPTLALLTADLAPARPTDISRLIGDLSAPDPAIRDEAGRKIAALGEAALPSLETAAKESDAETSARSRALIGQIRTASKALSIRRLMAIRTLGEWKKPDALPTLRGLVDSKEMFVAGYARDAIASIEGKPSLREVRPPIDRMGEVNLLPMKLDMVCQLIPAGGPAVPMEKVFAGFPLTPPGQDPAAAIQRISANLIAAAETVGNIRLDAVTLGWYAAPRGQPGNAIIIARGDFDSAAVLGALKRTNLPRQTVGGAEAFMFDDTTALMIPGDGVAVMVAAETNGDMPIEEALGALANGVGAFSKNAELNKLIQSIDTTQPFWMVTKVRDLQELFDFLTPFDTLTLVAGGKPAANPPAVNVQLSAIGADAAAVKKAVETAQTELKEVIGDLSNQAALLPALKAMSEMAQSVRMSADGPKALTSGQVTLGALIPAVLESGVRLDAGDDPPEAK